MERNRLMWASRRGMLELDLILLPFVETVYPTLSEDDQRRYALLVECEDQDLFAWFMRRSEPDHPELKRIVSLVLESARQPE